MIGRRANGDPCEHPEKFVGKLNGKPFCCACGAQGGAEWWEVPAAVDPDPRYDR